MPQRLSGEPVDVLRAEMVLEHEMDREKHRVHPDAIADEVRSVSPENDTLAEHLPAEAPHTLHDGWCRVGSRNELEQLHVAHGIEEVHHQESAPECLGAALGHLDDA